jgi:predicted DNA-binding protein
MATAKEKTNNTTSIRLDPELRGRLEALAERMGAAAGGVEITLSMAMRAAIERGMRALEAELPARGKGKR